MVPVDKKLGIAIKTLDTSYSEKAQKIVAEAKWQAYDSVAGKETKQPEILDFIMDLANLTTIVEDIKRPSDMYSELEEPISFREAWDHPDPFQQENWHDAIWNKFNDMNKNHVQRKGKRALMPSKCHWVKSNWVFKIKGNGVFLGQVCSLWLQSIYRSGFSANYSPVVHYITYHLLICQQLSLDCLPKLFMLKLHFYVVISKNRSIWIVHLERMILDMKMVSFWINVSID